MSGTGTTELPIGIVGAGIVGLATARLLALAGRSVTVFEKEPVVAGHQTGHNSGVVHSGIYYTPGSAKAVMCRRGVELLHAYCEEHGHTWDTRGKLVVARDEREVERLREIQRKAVANGVPEVRWLDGAEIRDLEPDVVGRAALLSPSTAIVDYPAIARSFARDIEACGGQVLTSMEVTGVTRRASEGVEVITADGGHLMSKLVLCAGLQSAEVARLSGAPLDPDIVPFRGEYLRLKPELRDRVHHLVYPVPDPAYPFLGVHFTPRLDGSVDIGPNAVLALSLEGYLRRNVNPRHVLGLSRSPGFRRFARQHWRVGIKEMRGSLWRGSFLKEARTYLPWLRPEHVERGPAGVRAQAIDPDGTLLDDFRIQHLGTVVAVRNAPSPGATSSMAIAEHIVAQLEFADSGR